MKTRTIEFYYLKGKTITTVKVSGQQDEVVFTLSNGEKVRLYHDQCCCECVELYDVAGDWADLIGLPLLQADIESNESTMKHDSSTWTFYRMATMKGQVVMRWLGRSNGYYSERVDVELLTPET